MIKTTVKVGGMSCGHCANTVVEAVGGLDGVNGVEVDLEAKTVTIEHDPNKADIEAVKAEIEDQGYDIID